MSRTTPETRTHRFERLVRVHLDTLYRFACWLSGDAQIAEDLVQETLLRAWRHLDALDDETAVRGWLITILRRENARRFERVTPPRSAVEPEHLPAPVSCDTRTEAFVLHRALARLPERYREPLLMQVIGGFTQREIAERLGLSVAGAGTRLFRARQRLRELLEAPDSRAA